MICLGIESSCDETALALVRDGLLIESIVATQEEIHALFGGVVPELASREHYRLMGPLYDALLQRAGIEAQDVDYYAVSRGPGLLGSLLVGVNFAKGLALASKKPIVGVNHLYAHLLAAGIEQPLIFPAVGVLVSGGHTHVYRINSVQSFEVLGRTLDDAAGEAFDKVGKMLGLPYPAGRIIDELARRGHDNNKKIFPRPYIDNDNLDFSFSGLKTAASLYVQEHSELLQKFVDVESAPQALCDMCLAFNQAIVDTLCIKVTRTLERHDDVKCIMLAGGVAGNSLLRERLQNLALGFNKKFIVPSLDLCTDNASMVAYAGWCYAQAGLKHKLNFEAIPRGKPLPEDWHISI